MALVLCTGFDKTVLETRKLILENAGHTVVTVTDETALVASAGNSRLTWRWSGRRFLPI